MTTRAVMLGFTGALSLSCLAFFNDVRLGQTALIANLLPGSVYGGLVLFTLTLNPLVGRMRPSWTLDARELTVILGLMLVGAGLSTVANSLPSLLMLPNQYGNAFPSWKSAKALEFVPSHLLAEGGAVELSGFLRGGDSNRDFLAAVPWEAWRDPLLFWIPLLALVGASLLGLALMLHRQWSEHEHLPYPIVTFTRSLLPAPGERVPAFMRSRLFATGLLVVLGVELMGFAEAWFPGTVKLPVWYDFRPMLDAFPAWKEWSKWAGLLYVFRIFFSAVAIGYLLSREVSLSLALAPHFYAIVLVVAGTSGLAIEAGAVGTSLNFGAYVGIALAVLYTGRSFYATTMRDALRAPLAAPTHVWGARVFLMGGIAVTGWLISTGLPVLAVLPALALVLVLFVVAARLLAETGLFAITPMWSVAAIVLAFAGGPALGVSNYTTLALTLGVIGLQSGCSLLPFAVNVMKLCDTQAVSQSWFAVRAGLLVPCLLVAGVVVTLGVHYRIGTAMQGTTFVTRQAEAPFESGLRLKHDLASQALPANPDGKTGLDPDMRLVAAVAVGAALVLGMTILRLRFAKFPFHPLIFVVWSTLPAMAFSLSFFLGWLARTLVVSAGGEKAYQRFKPLMAGLLAGELLAVLLMAACSWGYYLLTGKQPVSYNLYNLVKP